MDKTGFSGIMTGYCVSVEPTIVYRTKEEADARAQKIVGNPAVDSVQIVIHSTALGDKMYVLTEVPIRYC